MKYLVILLSLMTISCSQDQVKTHMGTGIGAVSGFTTCRALLNTGYELTAACTVLGAWLGSSLFYTNDLNTHTAVFVDTLNTAPSKDPIQIGVMLLMVIGVLSQSIELMLIIFINVEIMSPLLVLNILGQ